MPAINLRPRTHTSPEVIREEGERVTFMVEARATGPTPAPARFTFKLNAADGYRWENGSTTIARTADLEGDFRAHDIPLEIVQRTAKGARLLVVKIEGVLLSAAGQPVSDVKPSSAKLTVQAPLSGLIAAHRDARELTQSDLARKVGVSSSWISALERGDTPSPEVFLSLKEVIET